LFRPNDSRAAAFGARALEPEKSHTDSVGFVVRPDRTSSITVDAYRLRIDNVITNSDPLQGPNVTAAFNAAGLPGYTQASYYLNAWNSRTRGIDIVAQKLFDLGGGSDLSLSAATSFLNTTVSDVRGGVTVNGVVNSNAPIGPARIRDAQTGVPKNKIILDARYDVGPWSVDVTDTRYSSYRYNVGAVPFVPTANGNVDQVFSPENYVNLGIDYLIRKELRAELLVENLFDRYPDRYVTGNRSSGINPYSFIAPNGASGRFIEVGLSYTFN
jgi:iron complex outermembrane receptor protein